MKALFKSITFMAIAASLAACSDDNTTPDPTPNPEPTGSGTFVVATEKDGAGYILTAEDLKSGSITSVGSGYTVETASVWQYIEDNRLWAINDGGGGDGKPVDVYEFGSDGKFKQTADFTSTKYESWGVLGSYFGYMAAASNTTVTATEGETTYNSLDVAFTIAGGEPTVMYAAGGFSAEGVLLNDPVNPSPESIRTPSFAMAGGKLYVAVATGGVSKYATLQPNFDEAMRTLIANEGIGGEPQDYVADGAGKQYAISKTASSTSGYTATFTASSGVPFSLTPDKARILVYNLPAEITSPSDFAFDATPDAFITTDKIGQAFGRYYGNPFNTVISSGDYIYVFSPGAQRRYDDMETPNIMNNKVEELSQHTTSTEADWSSATELPTKLRKVVSDNKAGVMRIKAGETQFDTSFGVDGLVDLESKLGGEYTFTRVWHLAGSKFLIRVMTENKTTDGYFYGFHKSKPVDCRFVIFDASTASISNISGLPTYADIRDDNTAIGEPCFKDNVVYIPYSLETKSVVYYAEISATSSSYTAQEGLAIEADVVVGVGYLNER